MTISELIAELKIILSEHGDIPILYIGDDIEYDWEIKEVRVITDARNWEHRDKVVARIG